MATLTSLVVHFSAVEDSWLAHSTSHSNNAGTSEVRDGNEKPRRNRNKRRHKGNGSDADEAIANAGFGNPRNGQKKEAL